VAGDEQHHRIIRRHRLKPVIGINGVTQSVVDRFSRQQVENRLQVRLRRLLQHHPRAVGSQGREQRDINDFVAPRQFLVQQPRSILRTRDGEVQVPARLVRIDAHADQIRATSHSCAWNKGSFRY
jgi:hypothetical protein